MSDKLRAFPFGLKRHRELRNGEFVDEIQIADAAVGGGTWFDTDNSILVSNVSNVYRVESTGTLPASTWDTTGQGGTGSIAHTNGEFVVSSGATSGSSAVATSLQLMRQMSGATQLFETVVRLDTNNGNAIYQWGLFDNQNGFFFELNNGVFSFVSRSAGSDTKVTYSSGNGVTQDGIFDPTTDLTKMNQFNIMFGGLSCRWLINGRIAHSIGTNTISLPLTQALTLPFRYIVVNNTANTRSIFSRGTTFKRLSPVAVAPRYVNITTATTTVVKAGGGTLRSVIINGVAAAGTITMFDNTAGSGTKIGTISVNNSLSVNPIQLTYGVEFSTGLTIVTGTANDLTVIYD